MEAFYLDFLVFDSLMASAVECSHKPYRHKTRVMHFYWTCILGAHLRNCSAARNLSFCRILNEMNHLYHCDYSQSSRDLLCSQGWTFFEGIFFDHFLFQHAQYPSFLLFLEKYLLDLRIQSTTHNDVLLVLLIYVQVCSFWWILFLDYLMYGF